MTQPTAREIELEIEEVTERRMRFMDDAADFGLLFERSGGSDLRACAGQLPVSKLEDPS